MDGKQKVFCPKMFNIFYLTSNLKIKNIIHRTYLTKLKVNKIVLNVVLGGFLVIIWFSAIWTFPGTFSRFRNSVYATKSNFLIPISVQPNVVDFRP